MSSSAPKLQPVVESSAFDFDYADAGSGLDAGQSNEERDRRKHAEFFEQGRQAVQQQCQLDLAAAVGKHREQIDRALQQFALERQGYYRRIEGEVVALAIAIARKILHREVQIDPQALAGIVRVTLGKLDAGTTASLRVPPQEAAEWRHYFACRMEDSPAPEIHEDPAITRGECRIETSLGSTDMGLELQLKEIETGLLDLLAERPEAGDSVPAALNHAAISPGTGGEKC